MFGISISVIASTYKKLKSLKFNKSKKAKPSTNKVKLNQRELPNRKINTLSQNAIEIRDFIHHSIINKNYSETSFTCTQCKHSFYQIENNHIKMCICSSCKSVAFKQNELKKMTGLNSDIPLENQHSIISETKCPFCHESTNECCFSRKPFITINKCNACKSTFCSSSYFKYILSFL